MPPSFKHIMHFSSPTPPRSSKEKHISEQFYTIRALLSARGAACAHVKEITYTSSISGPKINPLLMQSGRYIMRGLSLSQHALLCLSTYSSTRTRTLALHLLLTVIYSTLAPSPTSSVRSPNRQPDEREGKTKRKSRWAGETESESRRARPCVRVVKA